MDHGVYVFVQQPVQFDFVFAYQKLFVRDSLGFQDIVFLLRSIIIIVLGRAVFPGGQVLGVTLAT